MYICQCFLAHPLNRVIRSSVRTSDVNDAELFYAEPILSFSEKKTNRDSSQTSPSRVETLGN